MEMRRIPCGSDDYAAMLALRERILRAPLGLTVTEEEKRQDAADYLLGCFEDGALLGCLILQKMPDGSVKMRQVAVAENAQGRGIGRRMLEESYDLLRGWGLSRLFCHARGTAVGFYTQNGWRVTSEEFLEQGIPHCRMDMAVPSEKRA